MSVDELISRAFEAERAALTADRAQRVHRAARAAATERDRQMQAREISEIRPTMQVRATLGLTWLPAVLAVCAACVLPVGSLAIDQKVTFAAVGAALSALTLIPVAISSVRSHRADESHVLSLITIISLAVVTGVVSWWTFISRADAVLNAPNAVVAIFAAFVVAVMTAVPHILVQRRRQHTVDREASRSRPDEQRIVEDARRALTAAGLHVQHDYPQSDALTTWSKAVTALPKKTPVASLCDEFGLGAITVWAHAHPYWSEDDADDELHHS